MGEVDLNKVEVTLLTMGKRRVKRLNGDFEEALTLAKVCKVTLSDGTQYFAEFRLVPADVNAPGYEVDGVQYENIFLEAYDVFKDGGTVVHERRGYI